jgi:hypothetical protein
MEKEFLYEVKMPVQDNTGHLILGLINIHLLVRNEQESLGWGLKGNYLSTFSEASVARKGIKH